MKNARIVLGMAVVCMGVGLGIWFVGGTLWKNAADLTGHVAGPLAVALHDNALFLHTWFFRGDLVRENTRLRRAALEQLANVAQIDTLKQENTSLRTALGLKDRLVGPPIMGAVFSYMREGGMRHMVVNRGNRDGVVVGDAVVNAQGALVGTVIDVSDRHATVQGLQDPGFQVTARIVGTSVTGLVRLDPGHGLILDLVQKNESVSEKQLVATSGNDQFPAGFLMGTISSIDPESTTLFKVVRIAPILDDTFNGSVLIIHP